MHCQAFSRPTVHRFAGASPRKVKKSRRPENPAGGFFVIDGFVVTS
jgi:hypothetical protein